MRNLVKSFGTLILVAWLVLFVGFATAGGKEEEPAPAEEALKVVTIRVWTIGPDNPALGRKTAFDEAGKRLNKDLEAEGSNIRVNVEAEFNSVNWSSFKQRNLLALQTGDPEQIADIIMTGHEMIGPYSVAGYIVPLDDYIARYPEVYNDIFPALWATGEFKAKIWGIPRDSEGRLIWIRRDVLKKIGWTESEIDGLRERAFAGDFTRDDLSDLAKDIKDAGVVETTMIHRPTPGVDWLGLIWNYGGRLSDETTGKLVVTKSACLKALEYLDKLVNQLGVVPSSMTNWSWPDINGSFLEGRAALYLTGGVWQWLGWQKDPWNFTEEWLFENITWIPYAAAKKGGKPLSVSHPLTCMLTSVSQNKDLAFRLLTYQYAPDLQAESVLASGHLAIGQSILEYPAYKENRYRSEVTRLLDVTRISPNHIKAPFLWEAWMDAIKAVETGAMNPSGALDFFVARMQQELGNEVIVEE